MEGETVGQCLDSLHARFPGFKQHLFDERGQLHSHICIYLNDHTTYPDELNHQTENGDELFILMVAGGG